MRMNWKTDYRSIYYLGAPEPEDLDLKWSETALLVIDVENVYRTRPPREGMSPEKQVRYDLWTPFYRRLDWKRRSSRTPPISSPGSASTESTASSPASPAIRGPAESAHSATGKPGWNDLLIPKDDLPSQIVPELAPLSDEIVVTKMTDSALTGSNLRLLLANMGVRNVVCCGVFTDQCVASTVRSLADESLNAIVVEDCCAAGSDELHHKELEIMNLIYCNVMSSVELKAMMGL
jgi:nicotinamidase-related amidase